MVVKMSQITLRGKIYRTWVGACPGVETELRKALRDEEGYEYNEVAFGNYSEGEEVSHFNLSTGERVQLPTPTAGYRYIGESLRAILVPEDGSEALRVWIEGKCDEVDVEWQSRLNQGFPYIDGHTYPLDDKAIAAYQAQLIAAQLGALTAPFAHTSNSDTNDDVYFTVEGYVKFTLGAFAYGSEAQKDRGDTKKALRACTTYEEALAIFTTYMEGD